MTGQTPNPGRQAGVEHREMLGFLEWALGRKFRGGRTAGGHPLKNQHQIINWPFEYLSNGALSIL
jgi:hypothetical protein